MRLCIFVDNEGVSRKAAMGMDWYGRKGKMKMRMKTKEKRRSSRLGIFFLKSVTLRIERERVDQKRYQ